MQVTPVVEARAGLSRLLADFRSNDQVEVVVIGAHRRPEAVLVPYSQYRELLRNATPVVGMDRLRELKPVIERLAAASGLSNVRVYGSVARGDENASSDVDLVVTPADEATLFDIAQFELDLEAILGVPVSAVSAASFDERDRRMLDEAVPL